MDSPDFVVVGGGSAGCVLANRLSENPSCKVTLIEAGSAAPRLFGSMPAGVQKLMPDASLNWMYPTEPDATINQRSIIWHAGKMLGGGSAINGMVYIRGAKADYDSWAQAGCVGWSWNDVLPYFLKSECWQGRPSPSHGSAGPLAVSPPRIKHPLADAFIKACTQVGIREVEDYCVGDIDGTFISYVTQRNGHRCSTAEAFLKPARKRPNLQIITGGLVDRVLFAGSKAVGVSYRKDGQSHELHATREIILAAGAIQSPAILLRSGIGPEPELRSLGIQVLANSVEVGKNLQEHASFPSSRFVSVPTYNSMQRPWQMAWHITNYFLFARGLLTSSPVHAMAFLRSRPDLTHPDIKLQMSPLCTDIKTRRMSETPGITVYANVSPPKSRGQIRLRSADPGAAPVIDHRLFGSADDMTALIAGLKRVDGIFRAPALAKFVTAYNTPERLPSDDREWEQLIRTYANIGFHPVASCRMGADPTSVVDPRLAVRGVQALRVADASIIPVMPSANTNAAAIMVGEKAADLIKQDAA